MEKTLSAKQKAALAAGTVLLIILSAFTGSGDPVGLNALLLLLSSAAAATIAGYVPGASVAAPLLGMVLNLLIYGSKLSALKALYCAAPAIGFYLVLRRKFRRQSAVTASSVAVSAAFFAAFVYVVYRRTGDFSLEACKTAFPSEVGELEKYISALMETAGENLTNASQVSVETMLNLLLCLIPSGFFLLVYLTELFSFSVARRISGAVPADENWAYSNSIVTVGAVVISLIVSIFVSRTSIFVAIATFVFVISLPLAVEGAESLRRVRENGSRPVGRLLLMAVSLFISLYFVPVLAAIFGAKDTVSRTFRKAKADGSNREDSNK